MFLDCFQLGWEKSWFTNFSLPYSRQRIGVHAHALVVALTAISDEQIEELNDLGIFVQQVFCLA